MGGAICIYVPAKWDTSIETVLGGASFEVEVRARKFSHGMGREYRCLRDGVGLGFSVAPSMEADSEFLFAMGSASSEHTDTLFAACDALIRRGALDEAGYKERNRGTGNG